MGWSLGVSAVVRHGVRPVRDGWGIRGGVLEGADEVPDAFGGGGFADPAAGGGEHGDLAAVGVEDEGVVAVVLKHRAAHDGQRHDVEDVGGVDAQVWGSAGDVGLGESAGDAEKAAELCLVQDAFGGHGVIGGAREDLHGVSGSVGPR
ncbi:hypothetical protein V5N34_35020 [Streptomyces baarnensis]|uniref:hypothetical protein n=1 Tax=Streptomyces baarnensis TaxID=66872 RepID=UPI0030818A8E